MYWISERCLALAMVSTTLAMKISAATTITRSSGTGISSSGLPCVQPKRKPTTAATAAPAKSTSCSQASLTLKSSRSHSSGRMK